MILTRDAVIARIDEYLAGQLSPAQLATWAFDQTYAYEMDEISYEAGAEDLLDEVLDELIFVDDTVFQLDAAQLRDLQALLREGPSGQDKDREGL